MPTPEGKVKKDVAEILEQAKRIFGVDVYFWYNASTGIFDPRTRRFRKSNSKYSILGVADILGVTQYGTFLAIEIKSAVGKLSEHQEKFLERIKQMGGIAIVARNAKDFTYDLAKVLAADTLKACSGFQPKKNKRDILF